MIADFSYYQIQLSEGGSSNSVIGSAFKFYRQRASSPDLSSVLDLRISNPLNGLTCHSLHSEILDNNEYFAQKIQGIRYFSCACDFYVHSVLNYELIYPNLNFNSYNK